MVSFLSVKNSDLIQNQQNIIFKQLVLTSFFIIILSTILDFLNNSIITSTINAISLITIFPFIYFFQKKHRHQIAKLILLLTLNGLVFLNSTAVPNDDWTRIFFFPLCLLSFLVLDWTKKMTLVAGLLTPLILFALSIYFQSQVSHFFHFEASFNLDMIKFINFSIAYGLTIYILFLFVDFIKNFQTIFAEQNKFYALGLISAGIGHEINNPLAIIIGKTDLLRKKIQANEINSNEITIELEKIKITSERIAEIIKNLKVFSRDSKNDSFSEISIAKTITMTLDLCSERMNINRVQLKIDVANDILVLGNESQLMQVILNLISNSFDAIELQTQKWIHIIIKKNEILFIDSGPGIPYNDLEKLMNPFFTTKPLGKGVGLGLSLSKSIIESHGGELTYNTQSKNTCFMIRFPIHFVKIQTKD